MDEVLRGKPRRMDPPALEDRHPVLDPQQGLVGRTAPAGSPPSRRRASARRTARTGWGWAARAECHRSPSPLGSWTAFRSRTTFAAGDQGKACGHTTHNVFVLLLFFISRSGRRGQWRELAGAFRKGRTTFHLRQESADVANDLSECGAPQDGAHMIGVDLHRLVDLMVQSPRCSAAPRYRLSATRRRAWEPAACPRRAEKAAR